MINYITSFLFGTLLLLIFYLRKTYHHWTKKGVFQFEPTWFLGNMSPMIFGTKCFGGLFWGMYNEIKKKGLTFGGAYLFTKPILIPTDLELIKRIMVTDFQYFNSHAAPVDEENDPLSGHLFNLNGSKWKSMRMKLTPTFTSGKMKMMFHTILDCTEGLREILEEYSTSGKCVNVKEVLQNFTTDVIGSSVFGVEFDIANNENSEFRIQAQKIVSGLRGLQLRTMAQMFLPQFLCGLLGIKQSSVSMERFCIDLVEATVKHREENNVIRKDFMHLLIQLKNKGKVTEDDDIKSTGDKSSEFKISVNEMAAQTFVFFVAGFETSSTLIAHTLYELAMNPEIQNKVRKDINDVLERCNDEITYDAIKEMTYLDKVVNESLRKHPPISAIPRECVKDYKIPGSDVIIEKGTMVQISTLGIQMDPEYYPDPEKFDPERFSEENKAARSQFAYLPFGEGPRICIGLRFGLLQGKVGLITILRNYRVKINSKTILPLSLDPNTYLVKGIKGGLWINIEKI